MSQKDNRELFVQVALRHGTGNYRDRVGEFLSDKLLIALDAIRLGREVGYSKQTDLLILNYLRAIDESFTRVDIEHDLMVYDFLKKKLARFENDIDAIRKKVHDFYERDADYSTLKEEWVQYKSEYKRKKAVEQDRVNHDLDFLRKSKARLEKNLAALEFYRRKAT